MERVAFLVEQSGNRIECLLNPESIVMRRSAGVQIRESHGGLVSGSTMADAPLQATGGGVTELFLDLLFDVSIKSNASDTEDVRDLTSPLWELTENMDDERGHVSLPQVRFVWGKRWNIPGVIAAISERMEYFSATGTPARSWMRLRFLRVQTPIDTGSDEALSPPVPSFDLDPDAMDDVQSDTVHEVVGSGGEGGSGGEQLYNIAQQYYGNPSFWRFLALYNNIDNPLQVEPGTALRIPSAPPGGTPT